MPYRPTCLEDSLDPWLAQEPDRARARAVVVWLMDLCGANGRLPAHIVPNTMLPAFVAMVPHQQIVVVWIIVDRYEEVAVRRLYDGRTDRWFGL